MDAQAVLKDFKNLLEKCSISDDDLYEETALIELRDVLENNSLEDNIKQLLYDFLESRNELLKFIEDELD